MRKLSVSKKALGFACTLVAGLTLAACGSSTPDISGITFDDLSVVYDGTAKTINIKHVPSSLQYKIGITDKSGKAVEAKDVVNVGEYTFTASFTTESGTAPDPVSAKLTITKATYDMSSFAFNGLDVDYDGEAHKPTLTGVPQGVTSAVKIYPENSNDALENGATDVGSYRVVASFVGNENYNEIANKEAIMKIHHKDYDGQGINISGLDVVYDGQGHKPAVSGLPEGVTAKLTIVKDGATEPVDAAVDVGVYHVTIEYNTNGTNYGKFPSDKVDLVVNKANFDLSSVKFEGLSVTYDGQAHKPTLAGVPAGVTASIKLYKEGSDVALDQATEIGTYKAVASFSGNANYNQMADKSEIFSIGKQTYDISGAEYALSAKYDGQAHSPVVSNLPQGVTASVKLYNEDKSAFASFATEAGNYEAVFSFVGDDLHEAIPDVTKTFTITKADKTLSNVKVNPRYFNVNDTTDRKVAVTGDFEGSTPVYTYFSKEGLKVEDINKAPAGEYTAVVTFDDSNYEISNQLESTLTVTEKTVKNISTYADLQAMALEAQDNFTLFEPTHEDEVSGDLDWLTYNGGNPADRWSEKTVYQLVNDIECKDEAGNLQSWHGTGWDVGHGLDTEKKIVAEEEVSYVKGTDKVVTLPRADGSADFAFGYVSVFLDGNGYSIKNLKLDDSCHTNASVAPGQQPVLGYFPSYVDQDLFGTSYKHAGFFMSTSFSTFKNITFEDPQLIINDTASTVVWAGIINSTEGWGNTYDGLKLVNPVIDATTKKANIGGIAGITLVLASADGTGDSYRGANWRSSTLEEMTTKFINVEMTGVDFKSVSTGGRNSFGGLYGESQDAWRTIYIEGLKIEGQYTLNGASGGKNTNNTGDIFGFFDCKYENISNTQRFPEYLYKIIVNGADFDIDYNLGENSVIGSAIEGKAYHEIELTAETYEANKYFFVDYNSNAFQLATGAFDAEVHYFELRYTEKELTSETYVASKYFTKDAEGNYVLATGDFDAEATYYTDLEVFATTLIYYKPVNNDWAGLFNDNTVINNLD